MTCTKLKSALGLFMVALLACTALLTGCGDSKAKSSSASAASKSKSAAAVNYTTSVDPNDPYGKGIHHALLKVQGYDPINITLNADDAPVTVANFCKLANEGFYNDLTFYRFAKEFCMQGGSSNNSAAAANDGLKPIIGEFKSNGVDNPLANNFVKGTVAMARSSENSATSTFFVTLASTQGVSQSLNGKYAAFGNIDNAGMQVVDKIVADYLPNVTDPGMGAISDVSKQALIDSITILD